MASFQCMKSHGYTFYIARAYRSSGVVDSAGIASIGHAWSGIYSLNIKRVINGISSDSQASVIQDILI